MNISVKFKNYAKTQFAAKKIEQVRMALVGLAISPTRFKRASFDNHQLHRIKRDYLITFQAPDDSTGELFFEELLQMCRELAAPDGGGQVEIEVYRMNKLIVFNPPSAKR